MVDPHCGFKATAAAEQLFSACTVDGWSFDLEVLATAWAKGFSIQEVPVRWENDERSKARIWHLPREFKQVYGIRKQLRQAETNSNSQR